ncbi:MAG: hypothetical protein CML67_06625 [Rhodobacteraceae bacterium]|nr:hypothetical protein [Paracoccaceae bacterium]
MTERAIPSDLARELEGPETAETLLVFLRIGHRRLSRDLLIVSDGADYLIDGETWTGFDFDIRLLSDTDQPPRTELTVQNVDRRIGEAILSLDSPARLDIDVIPASQFDTSADPRVPLVNPVARAYSARHLALVDVTADVLQLRGTIRSWDYTQEAWPSMRATQDAFPGLYL